ncbi:hypothetical protein ABLN87_21165 [Ruegeria sp. SCPT10]|uniref:hypothetical protein n=1 Tax=Ruegeria sp. SCP10 TaxID=3141377 RepID=UPI00333D836C
MKGAGSENDNNGNIVALNPLKRTQRFEDVSVDLDEQMLELLKAEIRGALTPNGQSVDAGRLDLASEDIQSIQSERSFRDRFGFVLGKRGRLAVVKFMDDYDLTSYDIRALYRLGSMTWDGATLRVRYVFWFKLLGVSQILGLAIILLPALLILFQSQDAHWVARLGLVIFTSALMFGISCIYRSFIAPFKRLKRRSSPYAGPLNTVR